MHDETLPIRVRRAATARDLDLPQYQTAGSAAVDLVAAVPSAVDLPPGEVKLIPTGLFIAIPPGYEGQIRPRSGIAVKHLVTLPNTPATIDSDYRGEIQVPLYNFGSQPFRIVRGMRIAQFLVVRIPHIQWQEVAELPPTPRGPSGFGHSGV